MDETMPMLIGALRKQAVARELKRQRMDRQEAIVEGDPSCQKGLVAERQNSKWMSQHQLGRDPDQ